MYAVGLDLIDVHTAAEPRIIVANVPDYFISEVSDHTLASILALWIRMCEPGFGVKRSACRFSCLFDIERK
jgi:lactate dehydrogenase-like 2-hydroxyacid dehydrogenase